MPTVFFIEEKKKPTPQNANLEHCAQHISENLRQSEFLTHCGCQVIYKPNARKIAILINTIYCFDALVAERAFRYISDFLKKIGLNNILYVSSQSTSALPFADKEMLALLGVPKEMTPSNDSETRH